MRKIESLLSPEKNGDARHTRRPKPGGIYDIHGYTTRNGLVTPLTSFGVTSEFEKEVSRTIKEIHSNKAVGADGIFVETLNIDNKTSTQIICTLWAHCGGLSHLSSDWSTAILIIIYEKGDKTVSQAYRLIAFLSHVWKVIEEAMEFLIRKTYGFDDEQLRLQ